MERLIEYKEQHVMNYIERTLEKKISYASDHFPVVMVCGMRQTGKSTMLNHIKEPERAYVSLSDLDALLAAKEDPEGFFSAYKTPLVIDEFQLAPSLLTHIKFLVDEKKRLGEKCNGLIWLTGSQKFSMMKNVSESLAGRCAIFDMSSLSSAEIEHRDVDVFHPDIETLEKRCAAAYQKTEDEIFAHMFMGGMPELYSSDTNPTMFFSTTSGHI